MKPVTEPEAEPTSDEWRSLYEAMAAYRDLAPWRWMHDDVLFGVENPETGQIGYCCVLGAAGEQFALTVYLGTEGLEGYWSIATGPPAEEAGLAEVLERQTCLMASLEDREMLETRDRAPIKLLGLRFRGPCAWPQFRSYRPGYAPWFVTGAEARFLTVALTQALDVAARVLQKPKLLPSPATGRYLVRTPVRNESGAIVEWVDRKRLPAAVRSATLAAAPLDRARVERARKLLHTDGRLEMDYFRVMTPIGGKNERRYLPLLILAAEAVSGILLKTGMLGPDEAIAEALPSAFLDIAEQVDALPGVVLVQREEALLYLHPLAEALGIGIELTSSLPSLNTARFELEQFIRHGGL